MDDRRDLLVVGAGFAGLACANRAAQRGLSVLVIDQQPSPGRYVHTTGLLVKEAQAEWAAPAPLVRRIDRTNRGHGNNGTRAMASPPRTLASREPIEEA